MPIEIQPTLAAFKYHDRLMVAESGFRPLEHAVLRPFHVDLEQRDRQVRRQDGVERGGPDRDLLDRAGVGVEVAAHQTAETVYLLKMVERNLSGGVRKSQRMAGHAGERSAESPIQLRDRLKGEVPALGGEANHLPQDRAAVAADIDRVGVAAEDVFQDAQRLRVAGRNRLWNDPA